MSVISAVFDDLAFNLRVFAREVLIAAFVATGVLGGMTVATAMDTISASSGTTVGDPLPPAREPAPALPTAGVSYTNAVGGEPFTVDCALPVVIRYDASNAPYDADEVVRSASEMFSASIGRPITLEPGTVDFNGPSIAEEFTIGIGWTGSLPSNDEHVDVLGEGGSITTGTTTVGGLVALAADTAWPATGFSPGSEVGVVLHELGHAAGLDHAAGGQMEAEADETRPPGYSPAEIAALRWIFTSTCSKPTGT